MPPYDLWLQGRDEIAAWWLGPGIDCRGSRLVPTAANGCPAFGQYRPSGPGGAHEPWALQVLEISDGRIVGLSFFLDVARIFPLFGLPSRLDDVAGPGYLAAVASAPGEPVGTGRTAERKRTAMADEWGPLGPLVGDWEAEGGLDTAYSHSQEKVLGTPYLEKLTFKPFGPVDNGRQSLYGLDYKTAMWRGERGEPVPHRGRLLALGRRDRRGPPRLRRAARHHRARRRHRRGRRHVVHAVGRARRPAVHDRREQVPRRRTRRTLSYAVTITINDDDSWSYDETTMLKMIEFDEPFAHTDHNTLRRRSAEPVGHREPPGARYQRNCSFVRTTKPEPFVDASRVVVVLADVQDRRVAWRSTMPSATRRVSAAASPRPRASGCVHTALTSVYPGMRMRSPAIAIRRSPSGASSNTPK